MLWKIALHPARSAACFGQKTSGNEAVAWSHLSENDVFSQNMVTERQTKTTTLVRLFGLSIQDNQRLSGTQWSVVWSSWTMDGWYRCTDTFFVRLSHNTYIRVHTHTEYWFLIIPLHKYWKKTHTKLNHFLTTTEVSLKYNIWHFIHSFKLGCVDFVQPLYVFPTCQHVAKGSLPHMYNNTRKDSAGKRHAPVLPWILT